MTTKEFTAKLAAAVNEAAQELHRLIGDEQLYSFALYTSGEADFGYVIASANTEEGIAERERWYAARGSNPSGRLRWSAPDWKYHDFSKALRDVKLPKRSNAQRDRAIYDAFIDVLKHSDMAGAFGSGAARKKVTLLVMCGDMSEEFLRRGMRALNAKTVYDQYLRRWTPESMLEKLESQPSTERARTVLSLYRDLALGRSTEAVREAKARNLVDRYDLAPLIRRLGEVAVPRLLDLIEEIGFGLPFTPDDDLATNCAFLIMDCGSLAEADIVRAQEIIARRAELDRATAKASTLAENLARVLHQLMPKRFPEAELNEETNHLDNPEPFLPAKRTG